MNPIDALKIEFGSMSNLATILGISSVAIYNWKKVPHKHVKKICELSEGRVTAEMLRPDLFGK